MVAVALALQQGLVGHPDQQTLRHQFSGAKEVVDKRAELPLLPRPCRRVEELAGALDVRPDVGCVATEAERQDVVRRDLLTLGYMALCLDQDGGLDLLV